MKNKWTKIVFVAVAVVGIAAGIILYFIAPPYLYQKSVSELRKDAGLTVKTTDIPGFRIAYAEGGSGDTIVMLHGFSANKDYWLKFAKIFTPGYRVIIPDLPGFGESSKPLSANYNILSQAERLGLLAKALKLNKFHLIGNSMGGNIAGNFAAAYPDMVKTLALFDAGGVTPPVKSERDLMIEKGINPYLPKNMDEFNRLMELNFYRPPRYPSFIKRYMASQAAKAVATNEKIYKDMRADYAVLQSKLNNITVPTLIVWGDSDKSIHVSALDVFAGNIRKSKTAMIKECGHVPMLEKPRESAAIYIEFLRDKK